MNRVEDYSRLHDRAWLRLGELRFERFHFCEKANPDRVRVLLSRQPSKHVLAQPNRFVVFVLVRFVLLLLKVDLGSPNLERLNRPPITGPIRLSLNIREPEGFASMLLSPASPGFALLVS